MTFGSLSTRLLLVVGLALLPALGFQSYIEFHSRQVRQQLTEKEALRLLDFVDADRNRIIDGAHQVLGAIISTPSVRALVRADCETFLVNLLAETRRYAFAFVATPDGTPVCAPGLPDRPVNPADWPYLQAALQSDGPVVGDYMVGRANGLPTLLVAKSFRDKDGAAIGVAVVGLRLDWLGEELARLNLPPDASALIADRHGTILARTPDNVAYAGQQLPNHARFLLEGAETRVTPITGLDGKARLAAYAPPAAGASNLLVAASLDRAVSNTAVTAWSGVGTLLTFVSAVLALVCTLLVGGRLIRRPVKRLLAVARAWQDGDLDARTGMGRAPGEFGQLAAKLDAMAATLQARERALSDALESTTDIVVAVNRDWRITYLNGNARANYNGDNPVGRLLWDAYPHVIGTPFEEGYRSAMQTGIATKVEAWYPRLAGYFEANSFPTAEGLTVFIRDLTEERRVALALRDREALFRAAFDQAAVGMVFADDTHRALQVNDRLCEITGYARDELIGMHPDDITHPDDLPADRSQKAAVAAGDRRDIAVTKRLIRADGAIVWVNVIGSPLQPGEGNPACFFAVVEDITERKRIETALQESEERLRLAMDAAQLGVSEVNLITGQCNRSAEAARIFGSDTTDMTTFADWTERLHRDDRECALAEWHRALTVPGHFFTCEYRYQLADGTWRWIGASGRMIFDDGRAVRSLVVVQDISARKRIEEELRDSETRLRMSQEAARIGAWDWDLETNRLYWSDVQCRQFGVDPADRDTVSFETWRRAVHPDDLPEMEAKMRADITGAASSEKEYRIVVGGQVRWINARSHVFRDANGRAVRKTGIDMDITERRGLEDEMRRLTTDLEARVDQEVTAREAAQARAAHAERMQALGQLAGGIAHDFNNVLQAISGAVTLMERRIGDRNGLLRLFRLATEATERGAAITRRLLAFGRRGDLRSVAIDPAGLLTDLREILVPTLGTMIEIQVCLGPDLRPFVGDKSQLETTLINLATNARDAMPKGGRLTLSVASETVVSGGLDHPEGLDAGQYVRLTVADTGIGMDAATLARASEPFFTTKSVGQGTGLGLAMSKGFAEQSGGALRVESAPNKGTIVTIWLPETSPAKVRAAGAPLHGAGGLAPGQTCATKPVRVLLVDDQDGVRDVLAMNLEDAGYGVLAAASGAEALALLTAGETINAVVTDLTMPGMDGLALIRAVRDQHPCMPAVLVTGYTGEGVSVAVGESLGGTFALLRKPVQGVQLTDCLSMLLAGHSISS